MSSEQNSNQQSNSILLEGENLTNSEIRKKVIFLAWPAIIEMFLMTFKQIVDNAMVGRLGEASIAAVGLSMSPMMFFMGLFAALGVGTTAVVARHIGAKEHNQANLAGRQAIIMSVATALLVTSIVFPLAPTIINLMGAEPEVVPLGTDYLRIISAGILFISSSFILSGVLRGAGDTRTPMRVNAVANVVNIILNFLLIFETREMSFLGIEFLMPGAGIGVQGAALGTSISRAIASLLVVKTLLKGKSVIKINLSDSFRPDFTMIKRIVKVGIPTAIERMAMSSGQVLFTRIVASLGTTATAAHHMAINAESLSFMPGFGFSMAATTLVGQGLGAKDPKLSERCGLETWRLGAGVMSFMGLIFFFFPHVLMNFLTNEPEVIDLGVMCLRIVALAQPPFATAIILSGGLRGAGDTTFPAVTTAIGMLGVRLILAVLFAFVFNWGLFGAWLAMASDLYVRGILVFLRFKSGKWKEIKV
ncbi:MATE family efflux transporter [Natranaerobius thermophilus]|uniref:Probable multidrug resistance protein NorM n=1 Tax=Natranaerobius thermophilus (strain ATCC BAA-1301 / DSM 18059 / JW/NM-WN-LF) TaxID=457570 RepID=B2A0L4_NATTJ|nr:MATE family efflux transporter [Natranaerobius thermophilus]ACB84575.1 MATE efflux family protein [Natranaerobius thermophilus JW/NM-WN-LF]